MIVLLSTVANWSIRHRLNVQVLRRLLHAMLLRRLTFFLQKYISLKEQRIISPGSHFQPIVYVKMGYIDWLEMKPGQIVLTSSQRDI